MPIIWHRLQVHKEPQCPPKLQEETWRTGGVLTGFLMLNLDETLAEASEGWYLSSKTTSRSSKTPERGLEDRWSLDRVPDVRSWWNFLRSFCRMIPIIWHNLKVHQEPPCPARIQDENWRIGGVLTGFLVLDLDENLTEASEWWSLSSDTTSRFIRNLNVLQDSRKRFWG